MEVQTKNTTSEAGKKLLPKDKYEEDLFNPKNLYLSSYVRFNKKGLLKMTFTKTLLKLLYEDLYPVFRYEPSADFCFSNGFFLRGVDDSLKSSFTTFSAGELEQALENKDNSNPDKRFFGRVARAIYNHMLFTYTNFFW